MLVQRWAQSTKVLNGLESGAKTAEMFPSIPNPTYIHEQVPL